MHHWSPRVTWIVRDACLTSVAAVLAVACVAAAVLAVAATAADY
jgi:preprotein translocase subunit SecE